MKKEHLNNLMDLHNANGRQRTNNLHRPQTDGDDASDEVDDVTFIVETVGVVDDAAACVRLDTILVYHPLQRRTGAETRYS